MHDTPLSFDFENYQPRVSVKISTPRRGLVRDIMTEIHAYNKKLDGLPTRKLTDLAALSDDELELIKPIKIKECKINLREGLVWAKPANVIEAVVLFPVDSPALTAFNLFDGKHDLQSVKQTLIEQLGWPEEKTWAYTRGLFLKLVSLQVCVPK